MDDVDRPLLTLCKSRIIDEGGNELSDKSQALLQTLSALCSFHSIDDLVTFLFSEGFNSLVGSDVPWIVFELGIYRDHNKTIELIATAEKITLADTLSTGVFDDDVVHCISQDEIKRALALWHDSVYDDNGRFQ